MNNLYLTILFCFFNIISFSQIWEDELLKTNPTVQEKSIAFEKYRAIHPCTSSTSTVINTNSLAKGYYILQLSNKKTNYKIASKVLI